MKAQLKSNSCAGTTHFLWSKLPRRSETKQQMRQNAALSDIFFQNSKGDMAHTANDQEKAAWRAKIDVQLKAGEGCKIYGIVSKA